MNQINTKKQFVGHAIVPIINSIINTMTNISIATLTLIGNLVGLIRTTAVKIEITAG